MARLLRFAAVAVLVGGATAGLSGCTGDADPVASPSPSVTAESPSPTPSASPSPTALSEEELLELIPEDARAENFAAASNFAKFFVREYQRMFVEADPALFALVSGEDCEFCASALTSFAEEQTAGHTSVGGEISTPEGLAAGGLQADGTWLVQFPIHEAEGSTLNADGSVASSHTANDYNLGVLLAWSAEHWTVVGLNLEAAT